MVGQLSQGTEEKAKGSRDDFSNFDGLVHQRIGMTLRCAPVISILWWLGGHLIFNLRAKTPNEIIRALGTQSQRVVFAICPSISEYQTIESQKA